MSIETRLLRDDALIHQISETSVTDTLIVIERLLAVRKNYALVYSNNPTSKEVMECVKGIQFCNEELRKLLFV